jgi:hypothetical protein
MNPEDYNFGIYDARIYDTPSTRGRKAFSLTGF